MFYYLPFTFFISVTCASSDRISSENIPRKFEILFSSVITIYTQTSFPFSSLAFSFLRLYESRKTNDDWRNGTKANSKSYSITTVYTTNTNSIIRTFLPLEGGKLQRTKNHFILKPHPQKTIETKTSRANISLHLSLSLSSINFSTLAPYRLYSKVEQSPREVDPRARKTASVSQKIQRSTCQRTFEIILHKQGWVGNLSPLHAQTLDNNSYRVFSRVDARFYQAGVPSSPWRGER